MIDKKKKAAKKLLVRQVRELRRREREAGIGSNITKTQVPEPGQIWKRRKDETDEMLMTTCFKGSGMNRGPTLEEGSRGFWTDDSREEREVGVKDVFLFGAGAFVFVIDVFRDDPAHVDLRMFVMDKQRVGDLFGLTLAQFNKEYERVC